MSVEENQTVSNAAQVKKMSVSSLCAECQKYGHDCSNLTKAEMILIVCSSNNIPTTGIYDRSIIIPRWSEGLNEEQLQFYSSMTVSQLQRHKSWSTDLRHIPDIDIGHVKQYLLLDEVLDPDNSKPLYTRETLRTYITSRAW